MEFIYPCCSILHSGPARAFFLLLVKEMGKLSRSVKRQLQLLSRHNFSDCGRNAANSGMLAKPKLHAKAGRSNLIDRNLEPGTWNEGLRPKVGRGEGRREWW